MTRIVAKFGNPIVRKFWLRCDHWQAFWPSKAPMGQCAPINRQRRRSAVSARFIVVWPLVGSWRTGADHGSDGHRINLVPYEIPRDVGVSVASAARIGSSRGVSPSGLKRERVSLAQMQGGVQERYTRVCALDANNADGPRSHVIRFTQSAPLLR